VSERATVNTWISQSVR